LTTTLKYYIQMKKIFFLFLIALIPSYLFSQSKLEDAKQNLIGSWQFGYLYTLGNYDTGEEKDGCIKSTIYNFKEDGTVTVENTDTSICKYANRTNKWSIVVMHDIRGKEHFAVRLSEDGIGERNSYDGNTFTDEIFMLVTFKKKFLTWIPKPQYKVPNTNQDLQYFYKRIKK
jgi:hypothetical protein